MWSSYLLTSPQKRKNFTSHWAEHDSAHPARYQQWLCWPCRHWAGGEGSVPAAPRSRPSTLPYFYLLPSSIRAPGMGALPQEADWPDASWLALLFSSFRFYNLSTLLLSLLNPSAPGSPAPLALPLSIILPFLPLQTFSQLFFQHSEQGYTAGLDQSWALICRELWRGKGGTGQGLQ